jgi:hypothetical protein
LTKVNSYNSWRTRHGEKFEFILKSHEDNQNKPGWETPSAIREMPELTFWEMAYVNDFDLLSTERPVGMGLGPIPISKIRQYGLDWGKSDLDMFVDIMLQVDRKYLSEYHKQQEAKNPKK